MLMIDALAGCAKTSTGMFGLGVRVPKHMRVSSEQKVIIKYMRSLGWKTCAAQAYNKSISQKLERDAPPGVTVATSNAFGHRAWADYVGTRLSLDPFKTGYIFKDMVGNDLPWKEKYKLSLSVVPLVNLCKNYLFDPTSEVESNFLYPSTSEGEVPSHGSIHEGETKYEAIGTDSYPSGVYADGVGALYWLADRFDIDISEEIVGLVKAVFLESVNQKSYIDYDDQNFLPLYYGIDMPKFDLVFVDELQDLNRAKQLMAFAMANGPVVAVGDKRQSIYGYAGADADAMEGFYWRMGEEAERLSLTVTRRCPKSVVREVQAYVPEFKAAPGAIEGEVSSLLEKHMIENIYEGASKMVLCRLNAPLTSLAFNLLKRGRKCYIQGRDIGSGLKTEIKKTGISVFKEAVYKALENLQDRAMLLRRKAYIDEAKIEAIVDRAECITVLSEGVDTLEEYSAKVDKMFKDKSNGEDIHLSSVHRAKGLEHQHVVIYKSSTLPYQKLMKGFQAEQELNLAYVAKTRALETLTYSIDPR